MSQESAASVSKEASGLWRVWLWVTLVLFSAVFLYLVRSILLPFVAAMIISVLLDPTVKKLRMRGYPRWLAIGMVFAVFLGLLIGLGIWLTPVIGGQLSQFRTSIDTLTDQMGGASPNDNYFLRWNPAVQMQKPKEGTAVDQVFKALGPTLDYLGVPSTKRDFVDQYVSPHKSEIAGYVESFFKGAFGLFPAIGMLAIFTFITPLLVVYMLVDMDRLKRRGATWIPPSIRAETLEMLRDIGQVFENYLRGVTTAILLYMGIAALLLTILGAPYAVLIGILFGALYLIPYIGPLISWTTLFVVTGLSGKMAVLGIGFSSPWMAAALITAVFVLMDRVFDMAVYPKIVGKAVGLNPIVSFFVVFSGGALFGLLGMLLAFPLAGAVKVILDRLIRVTSYTSEVVALPTVPLRHRTGT